MRFKLSTVLWLVVVVAAFFAGQFSLRKDVQRLDDLKAAITSAEKTSEEVWREVDFRNIDNYEARIEWLRARRELLSLTRQSTTSINSKINNEEQFIDAWKASMKPNGPAPLPPPP